MKILPRILGLLIAAVFLAALVTHFNRPSDNQPPLVNRIARIETKSFNGPNGPTHGILISVNAPDAATFSALMPDIVSTFKNQRMISPPDTSFLLVTVIGAVSASEFKSLWAANTANDKVIEVFLSQMTKADILHGTPEGKPLDSASLRKNGS